MPNPSYEFDFDPSVKQLATEWSCSVAHLYNMLSSGELSGFKIGKSLRVHRESANAMRAKSAAFKPPRDAA